MKITNKVLGFRSEMRPVRFRREQGRAGQGRPVRAAACLLLIVALTSVSFGPDSLRAQNADPADTTAVRAEEANANSVPTNGVTAEATETDTNTGDVATTNARPFRIRHRGGMNRNALVVIGHDAELKAGDTAEAVVVIGGSAKIHGKVQEAVVVIGGNLEIDGEVGEAAVAVLGNIRAGQGAVIHGDLVTVGGRADIAQGAKIEGQTQEVDTGGLGLPQVRWLQGWLSHGLLRLRPLAPRVGWTWAVWAVFVLIYFLIASAFPRPVEVCVAELNRRPATTFLMGLLTKLLLPLVLLVLTITIVGLIAVPFVLAALFLGLLVGKVAILEWLGFRVGHQFSGQSFNKPVAAFFLGVMIITVLYLIPVIGMLTFGIISVWGLGSAVMAAFGGLRKEMPEKPASPGPAAPVPIPPLVPTGPGCNPAPANPNPAPATVNPATAEPAPAAAMAASAPAESISSEPIGSPPPISASEAPPVVGSTAGAGAAVASLPDAWAYPRATFWERMGAAFLDVVLVSILGGLVGGPPQGFLVALAYFAGMWTWRSTTIGGIVLGLKVARADGQPLTFTVSLVRGLAAAFSVIVLFLGFLWIIWDKEKQGWHDRIAGTVVVKLPRGTPLVVL